MMSHSYAIVIICIKIIYYSYDAGTYMDEDCWLDTWMIIQSYIVGDMMMMSSYLYDDRLFHMLIDAYIPNWWYLVHADLDGYGVSHIW